MAVAGFHQSRYGYKNVEQLDTVMKKYAEVNFWMNPGLNHKGVPIL